MPTTFRIFGGSDKINELNLDELVVGETIGLNSFFFLARPTKYVLWMDNKDFGKCVYIREEQKYKPFYKFVPNGLPCMGQSLKGAYSSATFAIDFAIKQGAKKVELYGILDGNYAEREDDYIEYRNFYDWHPTKDNPVLVSYEQMESWKKEIMSYNKKADIVIPYQTL